MKTTMIFALMLTAYPAFAADSKIPFIVKQQTVRPIGQAGTSFSYTINDPKTGQVMAVMQEETIVAIPSEEISKVIKKVKAEVCNTIENGEFKLWLKGEASGKILGVGASSESGIEVTVKCDVAKRK